MSQDWLHSLQKVARPATFFLNTLLILIDHCCIAKINSSSLVIGLLSDAKRFEPLHSRRIKTT